MFGVPRFLAVVSAAVVLIPLMETSASAQVANLRITEVDPDGDIAEVTNTGGAFSNTATRYFCHRFTYTSTVPTGAWAAGQIQTFAVTGLNDTDSDLWLYQDALFSTGASIIHGVKYGPAPNVGRTSLAASVGLWPSAVAYAPAPPPGTTLAWDHFGNDPKDWYIDETPSLGSMDITPFGVVPKSLVYPSSKQDFESITLGDEAYTIAEWPFTNTSPAVGMFSFRVVNDVNGNITPRGSSTRWLRVRDQDPNNVQNRFYGPTIVSPALLNYKWTYWINIEEPVPGGATVNPRITVQHPDPVIMDNAWGIEFTSTGADLVVTAYGGGPASTPLYSFGPGFDVLDWVKIEITADFLHDTVTAVANGTASASLPINLDPAAEKKEFRFCFRGEGVGNVITMLIDDICVDVFDPLSGAEDDTPAAVALEQNVPNPFNPSTAIDYTIVEAGHVRLAVYDASGRLVTTLFDGSRGPGNYQAAWDGTNTTGLRVVSGTYFYRLEAGGEVINRKMTLLK